MKKYLLFQHEIFEQSGGWYDFTGSYNSMKEAMEKVEKVNKKNATWHVADRDTEKIVSLKSKKTGV